MDTQQLVKLIKMFIKNNNVHGFYVSTMWKHKRRDILLRDNNECQMCKDKGGYSTANTVHHIKHLRSNPELALEDDNLISLCDSCHWDIHHIYEQKEQLNEEKW
ncbi:MAG: HNH endonuclease signature motif containing protein [Clostridium sp.]|nr:HNH endonuclease signature motif containing protein [Clostridium sp.]